MIHLEVAHRWDGAPLAPDDVVSVTFGWRDERLEVVTDAPFYGDPPPVAPPGPTDRLWEHEVVELFLLAPPNHYLELELGPHGHHLVLELRGTRQPIRERVPIEYAARITHQRWRGVARLPRHHVPPDVARANAYAIHGVGPERTYAACFPVPGAAPDFHRLDCFGPVAL